MKLNKTPSVIADISSSKLEHTLERPITISYNPPEDELNGWMFAMIAVGCAFVVFVIGSIYLMCTSSVGNPPQPLRRHPTKTAREKMTEREDL